MEYEIGASGITDGYYVFTESPACGYTNTMIITNLPSFMTHDEGSSEFTI